MYERRMELEEKGQNYKIIKEKFLNYRQFSCKLTLGKKESVPAYALAYSTLPRKKAQGKIDFTHENIAYLNREEIKFMLLKDFNKLANTHYKEVKELIFNPPAFDTELQIRSKLALGSYDLSPVIVLDKLSEKKITLELEAKTYEATREKLIII